MTTKGTQKSCRFCPWLLFVTLFPPTHIAVVKLIDFGIATNMSAESNVVRTTTNAQPGTPTYMGPLAMQGRAMPCVDLWSLAVTLLECLLLKPPGDVVWGDLASTPTLTAACPPAGRADSLLEPVLEVLRTALNKPQDRGFSAAEDFQTALAQACGGLGAEPVSGKGKMGNTTLLRKVASHVAKVQCVVDDLQVHAKAEAGMEDITSSDENSD